MKRWQDRGEVQDSEEEALDFSPESQSPEQPRKRLKIEESQARDVQSGCPQQAASSANSPGHKHGEHQWQNGQVVPVGAGEDVYTELWLHSQLETRNTRRLRSTKPTSQLVISPVQVSSESQTMSTRRPPRTVVTEKHADHQSKDTQPLRVNNVAEAELLRIASNSKGVEELPQLVQALADRAEQRGQTTDYNSENDSSTLSSPLSTPEMPAFLRDLSSQMHKSTEAATRLQDAVGIANGRDSTDSIPATALQTENSAPAEGRTLRVRTEKQLHPYVYDRTLYQQQWRQRGLRPVKFVVKDQGEQGTQDQSYDTTSESEEQNQNSSSTPQQNSALRDEMLLTSRRRVHYSLDISKSDEFDFPDIDSLLDRRSLEGFQDGYKRRKISRSKTSATLKHLRVPNYIHQSPTNSNKDESSVPLSPPPTSNNSARVEERRCLPSGFMLPPGCKLPIAATPAPLPTPQISSDVRPAHSSSSQSESDSPPRRTKTSNLNRAHSRIVTINSSATSEEDSLSKPELEARRLRKERKRIRGVLPASWLKIDLKAQQRRPSRSPLKVWKRGSLSPPRSERQHKGIAQRISRTSGTPSRGYVIDISDNEDESEAKPSQSPTYSQQGRLRIDRDVLKVVSGVIDDERMERDWIDPMLSGPSRRTQHRSGHAKRQIKMRDTYHGVRGARANFLEEPSGLRHKFGRSHRSKSCRNHAVVSLRPPALSILDAPALSSAKSSLPQFIRLAQRQARAQPGNGRHLPSRKIVRLTTKGDTDDAHALLQSWREGTIAPRPPEYSMTSGQSGKPAPMDHESESELEDDRGRWPSQELINSPTQQYIPSRVRKNCDTALKGGVRMTPYRPRCHQHGVEHFAHKPPKNLAAITSAASLPSILSEKLPLTRKEKQKFHLWPRGLRLRRAQLESLENAFDEEHRGAAFELRMNILTETVVRAGLSSHPRALPFERFLDDHSGASIISSPPSHLGYGIPIEQSNDVVPAPLHPVGHHVSMAHRQRKRMAHKVDSDARRYRQPSEPLSDLEIAGGKQAEAAYIDASDPILQGLKPFGTRYATDFDVRPLPVGTFFHECTFIGSGDFLAALTCTERDLTVSVGYIHVHIDGEIFRWGPWTEEVAAGIERIPHAIFEGMQTLVSVNLKPIRDEQLSAILYNIDHMLRSVVRYCSKSLTFLDAMDRRRCIQTLQRYVDGLRERLRTASSSHQAIHAIQMRCWQYALVVATQTHLLSLDSVITTDLVESCQNQKETIAALLSTEILPKGLVELREAYEENHHSSKRESGIRSEGSTIASLVILQHCLQIKPSHDPFWTGINDSLLLTSGQLSTVSELDRYWYDILSVLPALEVDASGFACLGNHLRNARQNWLAVKQLVDRVFQLYPATSAIRGAAINDYVRATLARCFVLVTRWGWWKCEALLSTIFDFFAKRNLTPLHNEESHGSPRFLSELEREPSLDVQPQDRSFHIFLKLLASSLLGMHKYAIYSERKIGGIAWRFIPNHGRTYRKDSDVKQGDIDALRNHLDLLCTLYYASPPSHRVRLDLLRNLVDHSTSHREACRLSVRAWANLASFHASTAEPAENLRPLTEWYEEILQITITQYKLAKTEAETDYAIAKAQGAVEITDAMLGSTIAKNQQQIAATLVDALTSLKRTLWAASSLSIAYAFVDKCAFWRPFVPFDAGERRLYPALEESLEIVKTALEVQDKFRCQMDSQQSGEESQDYGDLDALQELAATQHSTDTPAPNVVKLLHEPISQLVSSIFGADQSIDDHILSKIIDIWIRLAKESVQTSVRSWSSYFDEYSSWSWRQLRDTEHRRRYTALFLARLIEEATSIPADLRSEILSAWFTSLIEREALLKYQHVLTEALLNHAGTEPLLNNVPFVRDARTRAYRITLQELRQKRLALISSVLSNMRRHFDETRHQDTRCLQDWCVTHGDMLRSLMQAMKINYQELRSSTDQQISDSNTESAYIDFVQHVVSSLQQHTTNICRVDTFFTDSSAFPLPVTDPLYVVGKLKSYVPRLAESRARKQLTFFIHTVSERAAVDNQQQYLVEQLCSAIDGVVEQGDTANPGLQHVMLTSILPVYIEAALTTACSWILALPILEACAIVGAGLLYTLKVEDEENVNATVEKIDAVLYAVQQPLLLAVMHPGLLKAPHVQRTLSKDFHIGKSLLPICAYLHRVAGGSERIMSSFESMYSLALWIQAEVNNAGETFLTELPLPQLPAPCSPWPDTKTCAQKQLKHSFEQDWYALDGQYFLRKCNMSKEVVVHLCDDEEEQQGFISAVTGFVESFEMIIRNQCDRTTRATRGCGMDEVLV